MGDKELAWTQVFRGTGKGPNTGAGVVGKYEDLAFHPCVVSLQGQGFFLEPSVILDFVHGAAEQGPKDALGQGSLPNLAFDVDVPGLVGSHFPVAFLAVQCSPLFRLDWLGLRRSGEAVFLPYRQVRNMYVPHP
jgi:hypothetical protein